LLIATLACPLAFSGPAEPLGLDPVQWVTERDESLFRSTQQEEKGTTSLATQTPSRTAITSLLGT